MFTTRVKDGKVYLITDNEELSDKITYEGGKRPTPIFFTGAPTLETAKALADGLEKLFGEPATYRKNSASTATRKTPTFSAIFVVDVKMG